MANVRAVISVSEEDSPHMLGTFAADLSGDHIPRAGELVSVGTMFARVQDVVWLYGDGELYRIDLVLPPQRAHVGDSSVMKDLRESGFVPLDEHGDSLQWEAPAAVDAPVE